MSAATASNTQSRRDTIYVALLDEGIDVWRPVEAQRLSPDTWRIVDQDYDPGIEVWEFEPGRVGEVPQGQNR